MVASQAEPLIGQHGVLLHVGPHKTGTSAVEGALHRSKAALLDHGVTVPGSYHLHGRAARAVTGWTHTPGMAPPPAEDWARLVDLTRAAQGRAAISSEYFDIADHEVANRIADDLGRERLHIAITAAPLTSVLPSNWQQRLRSGRTHTFDEWLHKVLDRHDRGRRTIFWRRHRLDWQVNRWAATIGIDRVHVIVGDKHRPRLLLDRFEEALGVPHAVLEPEDRAANRSLRWVEAEFLRQLNVAARWHDWSAATHARFIRLGATRGMQWRQPEVHEQPIVLPEWAYHRAREVADLMVTELRSSGVHVMGDLDTLVPPEDPPALDLPAVPAVDIDIAVRAVAGTARAGGAGILQESYVDPADLQAYPGVRSAPADVFSAEIVRRGLSIGQAPATQLVAELRRRVTRRIRHSLRR